jgi:hypothetical protein
MQGHGDLIVWQKAIELVVAVYKLSKSFPNTETYRRAGTALLLNLNPESQGGLVAKS